MNSEQPCSLFQMEQFSDDELDHAAEEDSDKEDQDLDKMFGAWLGELDKLTKVRLRDLLPVNLYPVGAVMLIISHMSWLSV